MTGSGNSTECLPKESLHADRAARARRTKDKMEESNALFQVLAQQYTKVDSISSHSFYGNDRLSHQVPLQAKTAATLWRKRMAAVMETGQHCKHVRLTKLLCVDDASLASDHA